MPVIFAQFYLDDQQGELTAVEKPSQIERNRNTTFYAIDSALAQNDLGGMHVTQGYNDKYGNRIRVVCFFACPLSDAMPSSYSSFGTMKVWIGTSFSEVFPNRHSDDKALQRQRIEQFIRRTKIICRNYQFNTHYLRNLSRSDDWSNYYLAAENPNMLTDHSLKEEKGTYEDRTGNGLIWTIGMFLFANLLWLLIVCYSSLAKTKTPKAEQKEAEKRKRETFDLLRFFIPSKSHWATPLIADINVLVFLAMCFSGIGIFRFQGSDLIPWGANISTITVNGQ